MRHLSFDIPTVGALAGKVPRRRTAKVAIVGPSFTGPGENDEADDVPPGPTVCCGLDESVDAAFISWIRADVAYDPSLSSDRPVTSIPAFAADGVAAVVAAARRREIAVE